MEDLSDWLAVFERYWEQAPDWWKLCTTHHMASICYEELEAIGAHDKDHKAAVDYLGKLLAGEEFSCRRLCYWIDPDTTVRTETMKQEDEMDLSFQSEKFENPRSAMLSVGIVNFTGTAGMIVGNWLNISYRELIPSLELGDFRVIGETIEQIWSVSPGAIEKIRHAISFDDSAKEAPT